MKLLFDQNLSHKLCDLLADLAPGSAQVRAAGLDQATDYEIWSFAQRDGFTIVSMDADFSDIATLRGAPPKVIWLRCGNQPTYEIERLLRDHASQIVDFLADDSVACFELYASP